MWTISENTKVSWYYNSGRVRLFLVEQTLSYVLTHSSGSFVALDDPNCDRMMTVRCNSHVVVEVIGNWSILSFSYEDVLQVFVHIAQLPLRFNAFQEINKLIKIISKSIFFPQWEGNLFCVYWWVWWGSWEQITVGYSGFRYVMINNLIALMSPLRNLIFLLIYVITKGHLFHLITHLHSIYCMWESCFVYLTSMHWLSAPRSSRNRLQFPSQSLLVSLLREHTFGHCGTLSLNNSSQRPKPNMPIWLPICIFTLPSACFPSLCYRQRLEISWLLFIFSYFVLSYPHPPPPIIRSSCVGVGFYIFSFILYVLLGGDSLQTSKKPDCPWTCLLFWKEHFQTLPLLQPLCIVRRLGLV